ncbi:mitochondrial dynamin GTPase Msp1 [Entomophthora muscae]|uniref:Mitochondrial dynamin GTPase Msp1 n=1 Tax=Entomophthora muscae TaxID=34485 RepID=A0ACC2STE6_9FUNG|nr:mitochondrial dynamin GTPase Msp1 [Entomophthora muscae]
MLGSRFPQSLAIPWRHRFWRTSTQGSPTSIPVHRANSFKTASRLYSFHSSKTPNCVAPGKKLGKLENGKFYNDGMDRSPGNHLIVRQFSFTAVPKFLLRSLRFPAGIVGVGVGAVTYFNNLINEATKNIVPDWLKDAAKEAGGLFNQAKEGGGRYLMKQIHSFLPFFLKRIMALQALLPALEMAHLTLQLMLWSMMNGRKKATAAIAIEKDQY